MQVIAELTAQINLMNILYSYVANSVIFKVSCKGPCTQKCSGPRSVKMFRPKRFGRVQPHSRNRKIKYLEQ